MDLIFLLHKIITILSYDDKFEETISIFLNKS